MTRSPVIVAALLSCGLVGCNQEPAGTPTAGDPTSHSPTFDATPLEVTARPAVHAERSKPESVVQDFLTAVREGDTDTTAALLTDKARVETAKHNLVVEPPGTPSAKFDIGEVQYIDDQRTGAYVNTVWSESDNAGKVSYDVVWALRKEPAGWRVAGIATEIVEGQPPVFLNFEDPSDMLAKWKQAEKIAAQHEDEPILQASPSDRSTSLR